MSFLINVPFLGLKIWCVGDQVDVASFRRNGFVWGFIWCFGIVWYLRAATKVVFFVGVT